MQVIVNRWKNDHISRPGVTCDICREMATVVKLKTIWGKIDVCLNCLNAAQKAIKAAVLEEVSHARD